MEWETDFRVPVELIGDTYILVTGRTRVHPGNEDNDEPNEAEIREIESDAKEVLERAAKRQMFHFKDATDDLFLPDGEVVINRVYWDKREKA